MTATEIRLRPVGVVHSAVTERKRMPAWGTGASVEIYAEFADALLKIEKHSHLWVLAWFHRGTDARDVLQVTPRGVTDPGPEGLHGVFAVRSPARPNPIGMTVARVVGREGLTLHFDRLDFLDGTPVIDLKPYFVTRDLIFSANGRQVGKPASREALRESLTAQAVAFHGALAPELALGVRIVEHHRLAQFELNDPPSWQVEAPLSRPVLVDALQALTRTTPGRGTLRLHNESPVRFTGLSEYEPRVVLPATSEEILAAADEDLFTWRRA
jgi:tRNA-Thr(GGU) m(6)t(6)A37 methyltransferase TsaA